MDGGELREIRKGMNLRQAAIAQALGMTPQFVGLMERGLAPIEPRTEMAVRYLVDHPEARPDVDDLDIKSYSAGDAVSFVLQDRRLVDGREWGMWRLDLEHLTLDFDSRMVMVERDDDGEPVFARRERYYVSLNDMLNAKRVLDWVGQIAGKGWGPVQIGHFVDALEEIFYFQGRFVYGPGFATAKECEEFLRERIKPAEAAEVPAL